MSESRIKGEGRGGALWPLVMDPARAYKQKIDELEWVLAFETDLSVFKNSGWVDAHSHLADSRFRGTVREESVEALSEFEIQSQIQVVKQVVSRAQDVGIGNFLQGGVSPQDWQMQSRLAKEIPGILPVFGLHPYWVAAHSESECELALDQLAREMKSAVALGETGLDFRPAYAGESIHRQISCFESQIEMAHLSGKALILHVVQAFDEALRIIDLFGSVPRPPLDADKKNRKKGLIHAFTGSAPQAEAWLKRDFLISIGGPVCRSDFQRLHQAVKSIPLDCLVLETDSPDQSPESWEGPLNHPESLLLVAQTVAQLKQVSVSDILDKSRENLENLLHANRNQILASSSL